MRRDNQLFLPKRIVFKSHDKIVGLEMVGRRLRARNRRCEITPQRNLQLVITNKGTPNLDTQLSKADAGVSAL